MLSKLLAMSHHWWNISCLFSYVLQLCFWCWSPFLFTALIGYAWHPIDHPKGWPMRSMLLVCLLDPHHHDVLCCNILASHQCFQCFTDFFFFLSDQFVKFSCTWRVNNTNSVRYIAMQGYQNMPGLACAPNLECSAMPRGKGGGERTGNF